MVRKASFVLTVAVVFFMIAVFTTVSSAATLDIADVGSAVAGDTVVIKNSNDWVSFVNYTATASGEGITFLITGNINVTSSASGSIAFSGTIIAESGVTITVSVPMFMKFAGTAKNLVLSGSIGEAAAFSGNAAAVVAEITGNAKFEGIISDVDVRATNAAGGIAASSNVTKAKIEFTDCINNGNIVSTSTGMPAGGIFAYCYDSTTTSDATSVTFTRCVNTGNIREDTYLAGGIMGYLKGGTPSGYFYACINSGDVTAPNHTAGGILGYQYKSAGTPDLVFAGCANSGNITAKSNAAGICGYANTVSSFVAYDDGAGNTYRCSNSGTITATNDKAAGILANTVADSFFEGCINAGRVEGYAYAAGICGYTTGSCSFTKSAADDTFGCLNSGVITSANGSAGGILAREDASAKTATLMDCINLADVIGYTQTGGIAGWVVGTAVIHGCINGNAVDEIIIRSNGAYAGGIAGRGSNRADLITDINNCMNYARVEAYELGCGGIIGYSSTLNILHITNCINYGTITNLDDPVCGTSTSAMKTHMFGGIVGRTHNSVTITNCKNYGNIVSKNYTGGYVSNYNGGIIGYAGTEGIAVITGCFNAGAVTGPSTAPNSSLRCGGIAGYLYGTKTTTAEYVAKIENCYNTGAITNPQYAGGIVGHLGVSDTSYGKGYVNSCINLGRISSSLRAGGIVGYAAGGSTATPYIENCINFGSVYGTGIAAGIAGYSDSPTATLKGNYAFGGILVSENTRYALYYNTVESTGEKTGNAFPKNYADCLYYETANVAMTSSEYTDITGKLGTGKLAEELDTVLNAAGFYYHIEWFLETSTKDSVLDAVYRALYDNYDYTEYDIKRANYRAEDREPDTGDAAIYLGMVAVVSALSVAVLFAVKREKRLKTSKKVSP